MNPVDQIVIHGSVEPAEIIEPTEKFCNNCGHRIRVSGGTIFGDKISFVASDAKDTKCPSCGNPIDL